MTAAVLPPGPYLDTPRRVFIAVALPYVLAALTMTRREMFPGNV